MPREEASASELSPRRASCSCGLSSSCLSSPGGLLFPRSCPMEFFWGCRKVPAVVAGPREEAMATKTTCHGLQSSQLNLGLCPVCSVLEAPVLLSLTMSVLRGLQSAQPGGTVTARVTPSGRGESCQSSVVCVMCSRLLCPYMVCFLSLFNVIFS